MLTFILYVAAIAQLVEHRIVIPSVAGSSPVGRPNFFLVLKRQKTNQKIPII